MKKILIITGCIVIAILIGVFILFSMLPTDLEDPDVTGTPQPTDIVGDPTTPSTTPNDGPDGPLGEPVYLPNDMITPATVIYVDGEARLMRDPSTGDISGGRAEFNTIILPDWFPRGILLDDEGYLINMQGDRQDTFDANGNRLPYKEYIDYCNSIPDESEEDIDPAEEDALVDEKYELDSIAYESIPADFHGEYELPSGKIVIIP